MLLLALSSAAHAAETAKDWIEWSRRRAAELEKWGQFENACDEWRNIARLDPSDVAPLARAAVLAVDLAVYRGKELKPGTTDFTVADTCIASAMTRGGQGDPALAYAIGRMRCAEGKWGSAWRMLGEAKRDGFDPVRVRYWYFRASVNRAAELIDMGRAEEAVMALEKILAEQPSHPDDRHARYLLAVGRDAMQEPDVAKAMLRDMLKQDPRSSDCHFLLGLILAKQGYLDEAEKELRETLTLANQQGQAQTERNALLRLCDLQLKAGKVADAEFTATQLQTIAKDAPEVLFRMGRVRLAQDRIEEAIRLFRRVVRRMPTDIETLQNLQQSLYQAGEVAEAEAVGREVDAIRSGRGRDTEGREERPVPEPRNPQQANPGAGGEAADPDAKSKKPD